MSNSIVVLIGEVRGNVCTYPYDTNEDASVSHVEIFGKPNPILTVSMSSNLKYFATHIETPVMYNRLLKIMTGPLVLYLSQNQATTIIHTRAHAYGGNVYSCAFETG